MNAKDLEQTIGAITTPTLFAIGYLGRVAKRYYIDRNIAGKDAFLGEWKDNTKVGGLIIAGAAVYNIGLTLTQTHFFQNFMANYHLFFK